MNIEITNYEDLASEFSGGTAFEKRAKTKPSTGGSAKSKFRRRGNAPKQFNGIHRRRTKKIKW